MIFRDASSKVSFFSNRYCGWKKRQSFSRVQTYALTICLLFLNLRWQTCDLCNCVFSRRCSVSINGGHDIATSITRSSVLVICSCVEVCVGLVHLGSIFSWVKKEVLDSLMHCILVTFNQSADFNLSAFFLHLSFWLLIWVIHTIYWWIIVFHLGNTMLSFWTWSSRCWKEKTNQ